MSDKIYEMVTETILAEMAKGVVPWRKPWASSEGHLPRNLKSGKPYRGINLLLLSLAPYASPYWLTFKQATERGGTVRKGERGTMIVFWKQFQVEDKDTGKPKTIPMLRYYKVFNVEQCENVPYPTVEADPGLDFSPVKEAERIIRNMPNRPKIDHLGDVACYIPAFDAVRMPDRTTFVSEAHYYSTAFHELTHSTGHKSRLNRPEIAGGGIRFGDASYGEEELVAEFGASMLNAVCGLFTATVESSAAYIDHWAKAIKANPKLVVQAAGRAQRAADCIQGVTWEN